MQGRDVLAAARTLAEVLEPALSADWSRPVPDLDFTVASVVAHATETVLWYALDLYSGPGDDAAFHVAVAADVANEKLLASLLGAAQVCAAAVDAAPDGTRGFHPFGSPDPDGFAAMACDELLVHGDDAARGLGVRLMPDPDLAARVLARLFPWHRPADDPWLTLQWANGRIDRPDRPFQSRWRWQAAPLSEWDGTVPIPPGR
jgi:uncharacterized protein (TIGR03083 family)